MLFFTTLILSTSFCHQKLTECEAVRDSCELALEKVPPAEWKRISDELAECNQHLEECDEKLGALMLKT
tara:strand:+ start:212 stop:418 length:207 start_codon:yes stop_codon:yes gene_type:complete